MSFKKYRPKGWPKQGRNVIFYPRKYFIDPNIVENSYVEGVGNKGNVFRMYLTLEPFYKKSLTGTGSNDKKVPPRLCDYARTERSAPKSCIATPDNGPHSHREGILLFSRVFPIEGTKHYNAGWCVLLAHDHNDPDPVTGIGRMEIDYGSSQLDSIEVRDVKTKIRGLKIALSKIDEEHDDYPALKYELEQNENSLRDLRPIWFRGITDELKDIRTVKTHDRPLSIDMMKNEILSVLSEYTTTDGRYGGCIIRTISEDGTVNPKKCAKLAVRYNKEKKSPISPESTLDGFMQFGGKHLLSVVLKKDTVQIIPFQQINCGPMGNTLYKKPVPFRTLKRTYLNETQTLSRNCSIVIRCIKAPANGNLLLGSIYATSAPIGNILALDENAKPAFEVLA